MWFFLQHIFIVIMKKVMRIKNRIKMVVVMHFLMHLTPLTDLTIPHSASRSGHLTSLNPYCSIHCRCTASKKSQSLFFSLQKVTHLLHLQLDEGYSCWIYIFLIFQRILFELSLTILHAIIVNHRIWLVSINLIIGWKT